jgi:hypothetical protein
MKPCICWMLLRDCRMYQYYEIGWDDSIDLMDYAIWELTHEIQVN